MGRGWWAVTVAIGSLGCGKSVDPGLEEAIADPRLPAITFTMTPLGISTTAFVGQTALFINGDTAPHQLSSDPHPEHTDCPELNGPMLQSSQQFLARLQTQRLCGFHDHLDPDNRALQAAILVNPVPVPAPAPRPVPEITYTITPLGIGATAQVGQLVTFINNDVVPHQLSSDPHPEHTDCPELNSPVLEPMQVFTTRLATVRLCGFHDHLDPTHFAFQGAILVNPVPPQRPPQPSPGPY